MATISKFYLLDATSPNTGTMPSGVLLISPTGTTATTGDAAGSTTARDATDVAGTSNPDIETTITSNADTLVQNWGLRRFVSRPLAAQTLTAGDTWTFSYARQESNLNHNQSTTVTVYVWRPSSGLRIGGGSNTGVSVSGGEPTVAATVQAQSTTQVWNSSITLVDGDILVFDVTATFQQSMATAYTDSFEYNGTTEASITTCASFVSPPAALTLFTASAAHSLAVPSRSQRNTLLRR